MSLVEKYKAEVTKIGNSWKNQNEYKAEGHLDLQTIIEIQNELGFHFNGYGCHTPKHTKDPVLLKKITTWSSSGGCD